MTTKKQCEPQPGEVWIDCKTGHPCIVSNVHEGRVFHIRSIDGLPLHSPTFRETYRPIDFKRPEDQRTLDRFSHFLSTIKHTNVEIKIAMHPKLAIAQCDEINLFS